MIAKVVTLQQEAFPNYILYPRMKKGSEQTMPTTKYYTPKELAEQWSTDEFKVRRFLREQNDIEQPGRGRRYRITAGQARKLKKRFQKRFHLMAA